MRCWTVPAGACAPEAAGVIHTDFERGFIKAEVCAYEDFKTLGAGTKSMVRSIILIIIFLFFASLLSAFKNVMSSTSL